MDEIRFQAVFPVYREEEFPDSPVPIYDLENARQLEAFHKLLNG
ncbi:ABC-type phosphate transport system, periplasmic component [Moorella thermoacetica Y72]|uniref:ABC-type phosphate transport system, periplasmic component n=1 Tax=Moorella thermoacetica Y72 TaxID=1325331 RepID=A0A0S6UID3_NEOTH|nr:ABC-type phosphate transport system, periplasmic component [Moorella thermoacetica Y72]